MREMTKEQLLDENYDLRHTVEKLRSELADAKKQTAEVTKRHNADIMSNNFSRLASNMGFPAESIPDVIARLPSLGWSVNEQGEPELRDKNGTPRYDVNPESWLAEQLGKGGLWHYLTRQGAIAASGGLPGGGGNGFDAVKNPWSREHWNETEQARIFNELGEDRAKEMAKAAGSHFGALKPA